MIGRSSKFLKSLVFVMSYGSFNRELELIKSGDFSAVTLDSCESNLSPFTFSKSTGAASSCASYLFLAIFFLASNLS